MLSLPASQLSKLIDDAVRGIFFGVAAARQLSGALVLFRDHAFELRQQSLPRGVDLG
jgi:hypothetical protein